MSVRIIGAAIGHGAQHPGAAEAPEELRRAGLARMLGEEARAERFWEVSWDTTLHPRFTKRRSKDLPVVGEFCDRLEKVVHRVLADGDFPFVIGGDHSCAMGTWAGVARHWREAGGDGGLGMVWMDAHLDSHTFDTSPSAAIHGMPLAVLLGRGQRDLVRCGGFEGKVDPKRCVVVGARSWEKEEPELLSSLGVRVMDILEIRRRGLAECLAEATEIARGDGGFWGASLDMDAVDPADAPGVGSPEAGGLRLADLAGALGDLNWWEDGSFRAFELVELSPPLDIGGKTQAAAMELARAVLV